MNALNILDLSGTHDQHDNFISKYLALPLPVNANNDVVRNALDAMLQDPDVLRDKPKLVAHVEILMDDNVVFTSRTRLLAVFILVKHFAESWSFMYQAAYNLLIALLDVIKTSGKKKIYPPKWTQQIFRLENLLSPRKLKGIIFGIDPLPYSTGVGQYATGYAFTFDVPDDVLQCPVASSDHGLMDVYCLWKGINLYKSASVEKNFIEYYGIAMVNFIRTITATMYVGSRNDFKEAWSTYNLTWLVGMAAQFWRKRNQTPHEVLGRRVLIFQNESDSYQFHNYCGAAVNNLLRQSIKCSHPSNIKNFRKHCLRHPSTWYSGSGCDSAKTNESVLQFVAFLKRRNAAEVCWCPCRKCGEVKVEEEIKAIMSISGY